MYSGFRSVITIPNGKDIKWRTIAWAKGQGQIPLSKSHLTETRVRQNCTRRCPWLKRASHELGLRSKSSYWPYLACHLSSSCSDRARFLPRPASRSRPLPRPHLCGPPPCGPHPVPRPLPLPHTGLSSVASLRSHFPLPRKEISSRHIYTSH